MGKSKDPLAIAMRRIIVQDVSQKKRQKAIQQIITTIYSLPKIKRRKVFQRLAELLAKYFYEQKNQKHKQAIRELAYAIAKRGLSEDDITFFQIADESGDYFSNVPYQQACNRLATGYYRYFGQDLNTTKEFCRVFFKEHAKYFQLASAREKPEPIYLDNYKNGGMYYLAFWAASLPPQEQYPQKFWFNNLLEAAVQGDTEAINYLKGALMLVFSNSPKQYTVMTLSELSTKIDNNGSKLQDYWDKIVDPNHPIIIVKDELEAPFLSFLGHLRSEGTKMLNRSNRLHNWFTKNKQAISTLFDSRCQEIITRAKYLLRPAGYDSIMINISSLNAVGILSVSFHPEGETFPDCKLSINKRGAGEVYVQLWALFREFSLIARNQLLTGISQIHDKDYLAALLEFVIVDALHRIIVGKPRNDLNNEKIKRGDYQTSANKPKREVIVRPFIRRLPDGHSASYDARQRALLQLGLDLPEGFTFVKSHERWIGLPEEKPAPLFQYSDESIMSTVKS